MRINIPTEISLATRTPNCTYYLGKIVKQFRELDSFQPKGQGPVRLTQSTADDYVIDLLAQCEQKLMKLMEDLDGKDVSELYSGMEDEEVRS